MLLVLSFQNMEPVFYWERSAEIETKCKEASENIKHRFAPSQNVRVDDIDTLLRLQSVEILGPLSVHFFSSVHEKTGRDSREG